MSKQGVPVGYKQTEVGVIPEDWDVKFLSHLTDPKRPISYGIVQTGEQIPNGVNCLRVVDIIGGKINKKNLITTSQRISNSYKRTILRVGDLVLPLRGKTGEVAIIDSSLEGSNLTRGVALIALQNNCNKLYFKYFLSSTRSSERLAASMNGSALQEITISNLRNFIVAFPLLQSEQLAIANALSDVDALISELEKLITKKQAIKTATMQQLLTGRTRLPRFALREDGSKKGYKQTELGEIPEDWHVSTVYELAEKQKSQFDDGDWVEAEHITDKGIRLIQTGNIGIGQYVEKDAKKYIYPASFEKLKCKELQVGDLLICRLAEPAGRACILPDIGEQKVITSVDVTIFRPSAYIADRKFYVQYFSSDMWFKSVLEQVGGTTHKRISRGALGKIFVPYPTVQEQTAIAILLSDMDEELLALEQRLNKTRQIKQGMMHELLTGKTRLVMPEKEECKHA